MINRASNLNSNRKRDRQMFNSAVQPLFKSIPSAHEQFMPEKHVDKTMLKPIVKTPPPYKGIFIKVDSVYKKILVEDIYAVEAMSDYMYICTKEKCYMIHSTMNSIIEKLPEADFMRVHKSFIVRLDSISAIEDNLLIVEDKRIPIGKTHFDQVMSRLNFIG